MNFINQNNHSLTILHLTINLSGYRCAASRLPPDMCVLVRGAGRAVWKRFDGLLRSLHRYFRKERSLKLEQDLEDVARVR